MATKKNINETEDEDVIQEREYAGLHSHSAIERELVFPKNKVLVDAKYKDLFEEWETEPYAYENVLYYKVPILSFVKKGGVFKNYKA